MRSKTLSKNTIVALDVGTTKICVIVAQHFGNGVMEIIGIGKAPSLGLRKGVVVDIARTVQSIRMAVREAELMCGFSLESAYVGIAGAHIHAYNSHGVVPIKRGVVKHYDIDAVIASAKALVLPEGQQILHVLPQYFLIDQEFVANPLGMHGVRLESRVHIITGAVASVQNLITCCQQAGLYVHDIVLEQLASACAVLSLDERELGVGVIDIGGGTSDFALYHKGNIKHTMVLPVAGSHFTHDIAIGLRTTLHDAERIKREFGITHPSLLQGETHFEGECVQGVVRQRLDQLDLVDILQPRAQELFSLVYKDIAHYAMQRFMTTGLVVTGGGSLLAGMKEVAQDIFQVPVRYGVLQHVHSNLEAFDNPMYATGYGLLLYALKKEDTTGNRVVGPLTSRIVTRMKSWISDFF